MIKFITKTLVIFGSNEESLLQFDAAKSLDFVLAEEKNVKLKQKNIFNRFSFKNRLKIFFWASRIRFSAPLLAIGCPTHLPKQYICPVQLEGNLVEDNQNQDSLISLETFRLLNRLEHGKDNNKSTWYDQGVVCPVCPADLYKRSQFLRQIAPSTCLKSYLLEEKQKESFNLKFNAFEEKDSVKKTIEYCLKYNTVILDEKMIGRSSLEKRAIIERNDIYGNYPLLPYLRPDLRGERLLTKNESKSPITKNESKSPRSHWNFTEGLINPWTQIIAKTLDSRNPLYDTPFISDRGEDYLPTNKELTEFLKTKQKPLFGFLHKPMFYPSPEKLLLNFVVLDKEESKKLSPYEFYKSSLTQEALDPIARPTTKKTRAKTYKKTILKSFNLSTKSKLEQDFFLRDYSDAGNAVLEKEKINYFSYRSARNAHIKNFQRAQRELIQFYESCLENEDILYESFQAAIQKTPLILKYRGSLYTEKAWVSHVFHGRLNTHSYKEGVLLFLNKEDSNKQEKQQIIKSFNEHLNIDLKEIEKAFFYVSEKTKPMMLFKENFENHPEEMEKQSLNKKLLFSEEEKELEITNENLNENKDLDRKESSQND